MALAAKSIRKAAAIGDEVIPVMLGGDAKVDNRKFKDSFKSKAKMLSSEEVLAWTSQPLGGI